MDCEQALIKYFQENLEKLKSKKDYWLIPNIEGFSRSKEKSYNANVELKRYLNKQWHNAPAEKKHHWVKVIVSDWGGVKGNNPETLNGFICEIKSENPATPLKGVASYSKIFSIVNLEKYAIYDARVAVSLNAIQYAASVKNGLAFNYIPGRNNTTGHSGKKIGFAYAEPFEIKALVQSGWDKIEKNNTYKTYLDLLHRCLKKFPKHNLYDLEMVLFANAEATCLDAAKKAKIIL